MRLAAPAPPSPSVLPSKREDEPEDPQLLSLYFDFTDDQPNGAGNATNSDADVLLKSLARGDRDLAAQMRLTYAVHRENYRKADAGARRIKQKKEEDLRRHAEDASHWHNKWLALEEKVSVHVAREQMAVELRLQVEQNHADAHAQDP